MYKSSQKIGLFLLMLVVSNQVYSAARKRFAAQAIATMYGAVSIATAYVCEKESDIYANKLANKKPTAQNLPLATKKVVKPTNS